MTESCKPVLTPGHRRGNVDLRPPRIQRIPRQRHVILKADQTADFAKWCVVYAERAAIALSPDQTLRPGWHHLGMVSQNLAVRVNVEQRVIKTPAARLGVTLAHPDGYICAGLPSSFTQPIGSDTGNVTA